MSWRIWQCAGTDTGRDPLSRERRHYGILSASCREHSSSTKALPPNSVGVWHFITTQSKQIKRKGHKWDTFRLVPRKHVLRYPFWMIQFLKNTSRRVLHTQPPASTLAIDEPEWAHSHGISVLRNALRNTGYQQSAVASKGQYVHTQVENVDYGNKIDYIFFKHHNQITIGICWCWCAPTLHFCFNQTADKTCFYVHVHAKRCERARSRFFSAFTSAVQSVPFVICQVLLPRFAFIIHYKWDLKNETRNSPITIGVRESKPIKL